MVVDFSVDPCDIVRRILQLPAETSWVELKENNQDPEMIAKDISALSNSAALAREDMGFLVWGVRDEDHELVGTSFDPFVAKGLGNSDLIPWLKRVLQPEVDFAFDRVSCDGCGVVLLRVPAARSLPVAYKDTRYIRIGSYTQKLQKYPLEEVNLFGVLREENFEAHSAAVNLTADEAIDLLDYPEFFRLRQLPLPSDSRQILQRLVEERVVEYTTEKGYAISNGAALLYARDLNRFGELSRKILRVVVYSGKTRVDTLAEGDFPGGYAAQFDRISSFIRDRAPSHEYIDESGVRRAGEAFPYLVVRELMANVIMHQDLTFKGAGPMIEVFSDRIEFRNPGVPLLKPLRFIDLPPRTRNEFIGEDLRKIGLVEQRGSGWDKVATIIEKNLMPAPVITIEEGQTQVVVYARRPIEHLTAEERVLALYFHAVVRFLEGEPVNNASVRVRFGIDEKNKSLASKLLRDGVDAGLIAVFDASVGVKARQYVPYWAQPGYVDEEA